MSRHVDHLLAAYVEQGLTPERAADVYQHVAECAACRGKLVRHEQLAADLRLGLGQRFALRPVQMQRMWTAIGSMSFPPVNQHQTTALLPILLSLLLVLVPLTAEIGSVMPNTSLAASAPVSPAADVTAQVLPELIAVANRPRPEDQQSSLTLAATPPLTATPIPAEPAPLAPPTP